MRPSQLLIILILISATVTGIYGFYFSMTDESHYDLNTDESRGYRDKYNKLDKLSSQVNKTYVDVTGIGAEKDHSLVNFFTGIWDTFTTTKTVIGAIFSIPFNLLNDLVTDLGMPSWVGKAIGAIFIVILITALLTILLRRDW